MKKGNVHLNMILHARWYHLHHFTVLLLKRYYFWFKTILGAQF